MRNGLNISAQSKIRIKENKKRRIRHITARNRNVYIPSIDGKDIYIANNYIVKDSQGYNLRGRDGRLNLRKFINTLDYSLDLLKLREIYTKVYRRKDFSFGHNGKEYSQRVINVTFNYSNKAFNKIHNTYVKFGYPHDGIELSDCVCVKNGELIAVRIDEPVENPVSKDMLGKYFYLKDGVYKAKSSIKALTNVANIRKELYERGFVCDGIKYVRFKRSSGSGRVGTCLFIDERLYKHIHKWEMCGIKVKKGQEIDLAALESYISLTLSSIIDTIEINANNILVIDDYESVFKDTVVATKLADGELISAREEVEITNNIWDGQSLLDSSMFGRYSKYGMLLLRSRFFKSCCFNANIQQWFSDNGITEVSQLNGFTTAKDISEIKLITTPSSVKYLKFGDLRDWLWTLEPTFGIVKHDKPTHFFSGKMVQCHYQLLNTVQLSYDEVGKLLSPSLNYLLKLKTNPAVLRHHIKYHEQNLTVPVSLTTKNEITYKLLGLNERFARTKLYHQFRGDVIESFVRNLRKGHVLVSGNYSTLFGNPVEMLEQSIGAFDGVSKIGRGNIHSLNFEHGETVLGSRSPHVTIANILMAKNVIRADISKYFNLTKEIVCVNSIGENLLEQLSGSDFDSDAMLLTNNRILIEGVNRNYDKFSVPTKLVKCIPRKRRYNAESQADLDIKTSINKIGEIINLSQELNSKLWSLLYSSGNYRAVSGLYCDIAQLDVMSNLEIDSAKRENPADNAGELKLIKKKYEVRDEDGRYIRPMFFKYLDIDKGYYDPKRKAYQYHDTAMDYLQKHISSFRLPKADTKTFCKFTDLLRPPSEADGRINFCQVNRIVRLVRETRAAVTKIWQEAGGGDSQEKYMRALKAKQDCSNEIGNMTIGAATMYYLLTLIEQPEYSDITTSLFHILFSAPNKSFYSLIAESQEKVGTLTESACGDIQLYDFKYIIQ